METLPGFDPLGTFVFALGGATLRLLDRRVARLIDTTT